MKTLNFTKYQGTGNDFVVIDDRNEKFDIEDEDLISRMCDRRFGIGSDGLILLRQVKDYDFEMVYFNTDGRQSSMCGNGGRCIVHFAHSLGIFEKSCKFLAIDGPHEAVMIEEDVVKLGMHDVDEITEVDDQTMTLDTGSPHYVTVIDDAADFDVVGAGRDIRNSDPYKDEGINVNFLSQDGDSYQVNTYERGVEDETLSCGTGATAAAISASLIWKDKVSSPVPITTKGGSLKIHFDQVNNKFENVWLEGPAKVVFTGEFDT